MGQNGNGLKTDKNGNRTEIKRERNGITHPVVRTGDGNFFLTPTVVTMECSLEVVVFACSNKRGGAGPNEIKNGGQIQTKTNFLHYKPAYNGHNTLAK